MKTPYTYDGIVELLWDAYEGGLLHAGTINLLQNPPAVILTTRQLLVGTPAGPGGVPAVVLGVKDKWNAAKTAKLDAGKTYRVALKAGRELIMTCIDSAKPQLGRRWNSNWNAVGFLNGSLEVADNPSAQLEQWSNYYATYPAREVVGINGVDCTAAACLAAATLINQTQTAYNATKGAAAAANLTLDMCMNVGRNRLMGVRNELGQLLADDDPRWLDYGFEMPAHMASPDVPEDFTVVNAGSGALHFRWNATERADSYRFVLKDAAAVVLVDEIVWENEFMAADLTTGSTVSATVSARNITGESQFTAPVVTTVP